MTQIQIIELHGRPVALALGEQAIIADHITGEDRQVAAGMALYALEVQSGERAGPYTHDNAERYARDAIASRHPVAPRVRRGAHPRRATAA